MLHPLTIYLALLLAVNACASPAEPAPTVEIVAQSGPEDTAIPPNLATEASWSDIIDEGVDGVGWLATFDDPELEKIVAEALRNNHQPAVAGANLSAAAQLALQAGAALALAVSVDPGAQATERSNVGRITSGAALNLGWERELWNRLNSAAAAAGEDFRATQAEFEAARQSLVAQTAKAWFLATEANLQLALSREAADLYEQTLEIVETRVAAGAASPQDIFLAKADLAAAKQRLRQAIGALIQAVRSIESILGRYPATELGVVRESVPITPAIPVGIPAGLLERRPDLRAAERRVAAAFERTESVRATKLPSLPLTAADGSPSNELIELIGAGSNFFSRAANFVAPRDIVGDLDVRAQIETARQEAALANYGAVALRAFGEVENALTSEALLQERENLLAADVDNNAAALAAAQTRYDMGAVDLLRVLQMQARALNSRISLVRIRNARRAHRVDLYLALGGGLGQ